MKDYAVNVRAIVRATVTDQDAAGDPESWEVYDREAGDDPDTVVLRCDQLVRVSAETPEAAVEAAKNDAAAIVLPGHVIDDVDLWVDESIDIDPEFADEPAAPSP